MFRNPRENASSTVDLPVKPSTGRPPTPPHGDAPSQPRAVIMTSKSSTTPLTPRPNSKTNAPSIASKSVKKLPYAKSAAKPNASILSFFKKVDSPLKDESLFVPQKALLDVPRKSRGASPKVGDSDDDSYGNGSELEVNRFNESGASIKRRKTSNGSTTSAADDGSITDPTTSIESLEIGAQDIALGETCTPPPPAPQPKGKLNKAKRRGPFLSDSESENEEESVEVDNAAVQKAATKAVKKELDDSVAEQSDELDNVVSIKPVDQEDIVENRPVVPTIDFVESVGDGLARNKRVPVAAAQAKWEALQPKKKSTKGPTLDDAANKTESPPIPFLKKENTSVDEWAGFEDEDFLDMDEFADGEEFVERKWMAEQARLEAAEGGQEEIYEAFGKGEIMKEELDESMTATCPMCEASLGGISSDQATRHVNACLDGNPLPFPDKVDVKPSEIKLMPVEASKRFQKSAIPRPGQANPFEIGHVESAPSSAFSKLMSGHAEDAAWASAAAAEHSSRGKPAYQRTCPFYKIMPGFFICVDAFRYGAVQGCKAYFLSHFHSDHYIGLTSTWCHGPIYCSKVTGNLVKQQLKVDAKWVKCLDFEARLEVPDTEGVDVTMIPANHCPGSSLFLFEKTLGRGRNRKIQRVLHCGDFRACPEHIKHPLLMPDIVDSINGKNKHQKIDVCYLDTTYLNPRYAFPSQEEVITACADMCVSLRKEKAEETDAWEVVKRERAGTGMQKFVANPTLKAEDSSIAMSLSSTKDRGRLLVVCGTYSIGKERICMGIARALDCKIWAPPGKMRICAALEDEELMARMTDDPREAQIHMQMLMELRPETLNDYLTGFKPHFSRIVGFRPSGWNYRPPNSRFTDTPSIPTILSWRSSFSMADLVPQRGSTKEASCFGVPYSEHSSFRELTMFVCALRIEKVVPTVNVGNAAGRAKMKAWIDRWMAERRKRVGGVVKIGDGEGEVRWTG